MLSAILMILAGFVVIGLIIVANAYFVAQEFSFMSVDRTQLRSQAAEGDKTAQRALAITQQTSFMLSGAQLGITITGLLIGYVAEPLVGQGLGVLLGGVGVPSAVSITVGTILALFISTIATMLFAELFPKNYTIAAPMKTARWLAASTQIYLRLFGWLIHFFEYSSNAILKVFGIEPVEDYRRFVEASLRGRHPLDPRTRQIERPDYDAMVASFERGEIDTGTGESVTSDHMHREQFGARDRLDQEVVVAGLVARRGAGLPALPVLEGVGRHHDDGQLLQAQGAHAAGHLPAGQAGHGDVQQQRVGRRGLHGVQAGVAAAGLVHGKAQRLQQAAQQRARGLVVVDHHHRAARAVVAGDARGRRRQALALGEGAEFIASVGGVDDDPAGQTQGV